MTIPSSMVSITCGKCAHNADFEAFTRTTLRGTLPTRHFQCPACKAAWTYEVTTPALRHPAGFTIPAERRLSYIPTSL